MFTIFSNVAKCPIDKKIKQYQIIYSCIDGAAHGGPITGILQYIFN